MLFLITLYAVPLLSVLFGIVGAVIVGHKIAHLYFGHKIYQDSFKDKILSIIYVIVLGQASPMQLAYVHRMHHKYCDTDKDPHSPKYIGRLNVYFLNWRKMHLEPSIILDYRKSSFQKWLTKHFLKLHYLFLFVIWSFGGVIYAGLISSIVVFNFHYSSITNTFSHSTEGPINNHKIRMIMPWGYKHKDHHNA